MYAMYLLAAVVAAKFVLLTLGLILASAAIALLISEGIEWLWSRLS